MILGKTVAAELAGAHPGRTTHPFDVTRTPGGSSPAAVAAQMCAAALGTQVSGCVIRSASYCGNFALEPTQGAMNCGEHQASRMSLPGRPKGQYRSAQREATPVSTTGVHAGSLEDMWQVAMAIAQRAGGDPRMPAFAAQASRPKRRGHVA